MGSQGVLSEVRAWDDAMSVGKEDRGVGGGRGGDLCDSLEMGPAGKGALLQVWG